MEILLSNTEENYLKAIYHLSNSGVDAVSTNALAESMSITPATVSDMIRKLADKNIISYAKYKGVQVNKTGKALALDIIRKHRLWEVFLVEKLNFKWDEVHEIAEQLEHIQSAKLIEQLDHYLGRPKVDPHGDPIPDKNGVFHVGPSLSLSESQLGDGLVLTSVVSNDPSLLQYLDQQEIHLGLKFRITAKIEFDQSLKILTEKGKEFFISHLVASNLMVNKIE